MTKSTPNLKQMLCNLPEDYYQKGTSLSVFLSFFGYNLVT